MTRTEKGALFIAALKEKQNRQDVTQDVNHRKFIKKNAEHNYLIKKHKLTLNKKTNLHPLYVVTKILTRK